MAYAHQSHHPSTDAVAKQSFSFQTNGFPNLRHLFAKRNLNLLVATANPVRNRAEHYQVCFHDLKNNVLDKRQGLVYM